MPFAVDQQLVEALAPQRSHIPLRNRVRPGGADRSLDDPHTAAGEHLIEHRGELAVAVADQDPELAGTFAEIYQEVASLLDGPRTGGVRGDAQDMHPPGGDLHHEEHVQALEEHGVNVQEIARQDS